MEAEDFGEGWKSTGRRGQVGCGRTICSGLGLGSRRNRLDMLRFVLGCCGDLLRCHFLTRSTEECLRRIVCKVDNPSKSPDIQCFLTAKKELWM